MQHIVAFVAEVLALTVLTAVFEFLLPSGKIKSTAVAAIRMIYIAAVCDEIIGIFTRLEV